MGKLRKLMNLRAAFEEAIFEVAKEDDRIVLLGADSLPWNFNINTLKLFKENAPNRLVDVGIAEDHWIVVAAGLAIEGFIPICANMAWIYSKVFNQIRQSINTDRGNVKMFGTADWASNAGTSHQTFEDIALMRVIPNMVVGAPADAVEIKKMTKAAIKYIGPTYIRYPYSRTLKIPTIFNEDYQFKFGVAATVREGNDVTIMGINECVYNALLAANKLAKDGINARVIDMSTIKPIDQKTIIKAAKETGAIITTEIASIFGGLGEAVAGIVGENYPVPIKRIGIRDRYGQSTREENVMLADYHLRVDDLITAAKEVVSRK
jgi:transketolase